MTATAPLTPQSLVRAFESIARERMQGLPFVNSGLEVEAVAFRDFDEHRFGVLIAPWFMNMLLLPGNDEWTELKQGDKVTLSFPAGDYEFTVCSDEEIAGSYLSAVLFRTVADFPDQATAREVASDIVERLFESPDEADGRPADERPTARRYSRRALLSGQGAD